MPVPTLNSAMLGQMRELEVLLMDKTCSILRKPVGANGIRQGTPATVTGMTSVPCSVELPQPKDDPFRSLPAPDIEGGVPRQADRLITLPITHPTSGLAINVQPGDVIRVGSTDYKVQDLGTDESFATAIRVNAELVT